MPSVFSSVHRALLVSVFILFFLGEFSLVSGSFFTSTGDFKPDDKCVSEDTAFFVGISRSFIMRSMNAAIPYINEQMVSFIIPPQEIPHGRTGDIKIENFYIDKSEAVLGQPSPQDLTIYLNQVSFLLEDTEFEVSSGINCTGFFWGDMENASVKVTLSSSVTEKGELVLEATKTDIEWGSLTIHHKLSDTMCDVAEAAVSIFIGDLDEYVMARMKEEVPDKVSAMVTEQLKNYTSSIPFPIADVVFTDENVIFEFQLSNLEALAPIPSGTHSTLLVSVKEANKKRDFSFLFPEKHIMNRVDYMVCRGEGTASYELPEEFNTGTLRALFPELYLLCEGCSLELSLALRKGIKVEFNQRMIDVVVKKLEVGLFMKAESLEQAQSVQKFIVENKDALPDDQLWVTESFTEAPLADPQAKIPILQISLMGKVSAENVLTLEFSKKIKFDFLPLEDVEVEIEKVNVKDLDSKKLRSFVTTVLHYNIETIVNAESPTALPEYMDNPKLKLRQGHLEFSFNLKLLRLLEFFRKVNNQQEESP